jgi:hypothetical protein
MTTVYLGNENESGKVRTTIRLPEGIGLADALVTITHPGDGVWVNHSQETAPNWVASEDEALASLVAEHYGIEVRDPLPAGERNEFPEEVEFV